MKIKTYEKPIITKFVEIDEYYLEADEDDWLSGL